MSDCTIVDFDIVYCTSKSNDINTLILKQTFENVYVVLDSEQVMCFIMSRKDRSIIVLIDIDQQPSLLQQIRQYDNIIPIACSAKDTTSTRMLKCIQLGAFDFIGKPFSETVLKTLFLNIYRRKKNGQSLTSKFQGRLKSSYSIMNNYRLTDTPHHDINISRKQKVYLKECMNNWSFSPHALSEPELIYCTFTVFEQTFDHFPELACYKLKQDAMYDFIVDICNSYHNSNPYHNFRHAVDVLQSTWFYLRSLGVYNSCQTRHRLVSLLKPIHILALLMASIGHDIGHPGVNNGFMVRTASPLAILYNDTSVLENYHSMAFFNLLSIHYHKSSINITSLSGYKEFRQVIVNGILCTDMSCHQEHVDKTKRQIERLRSNTLGLDTEVARNRECILVCNAIMKCADISNCARPFEVAKKWAIALSQELFQQGDLEKELLLSSLPIYTRGQISLSDFQLGFMKNVAMELYATVSDLFPELVFCKEMIQENMNTWLVVGTCGFAK